MQYSVLIRQSGHTVHPDKVCLTVSSMYTHPVQGLASLRTLDYNSVCPNLGCTTQVTTHELHDAVTTVIECEMCQEFWRHINTLFLFF